MKTCFGYVRVSTQKQGEGVSLDAQREAIQAFASRQNLQVTEWFEEKETAAKSGRPIFTKMLKLLWHRKADGLIIHKIDRSARNLKDWATIGDLSDAGIDVYFATESLDFRSRGGRLTADIQAVIAADYIRNLREETIKGLRGRLKQGLYPFRAPIGYCDTGRGNAKTICPIKGPLVRQLLALYASGAHSLRSLEIEAKNLGLRNHAGQPLSLHGVETILRNPFYCGIIFIARTGDTYQGSHEPLIDTTMFQRIQAIKAGKAGKKVTRHNHCYHGLFRCGLCDAALTPERQKGRVYYRCQTALCATKTIREDVLDTHINDAFARLQLSPTDADQIDTAFRAWLTANQQQEETAGLALQISQTETRLTRLTDLMVDGTITADDYHQRRRDLTLELAAQRERQNAKGQNDLTEDDIKKFLELTKSLAVLHRRATPEEKRSLVENCFSNRRLIGRNLELEPQNWLSELKCETRVPDGDPHRHTSRTFFPEDVLDGYRKVLAIFLKNEESDKVPITPQWKHNLKPQQVDDLPDTL